MLTNSSTRQSTNTLILLTTLLELSVASILTQDWISKRREYSTISTNTDPVKEYTDTGINTSHTEFISQIPLATYINIRKHLDDIQCQQKADNYHSVGPNTAIESNRTDISINTNNSCGFDTAAWSESYQSAEWSEQLHTEEEALSEPSLTSAELIALNKLYQSDSKLMIGTLRVAVHTSGTVDETEGLNCDLKQLEVKPQTTKQHQQHTLVVF